MQKKIIVFGFLGLFVLMIPVTVLLLRTRQETRSGANTTTAIPAAVCGNAAADIMLIIDKSGSMASSLGNTTTTKLAAAKTAATNFINIISANTQNHAGLTTFQSTATLNSKLTNNFSSVSAQISQITAGGSTCTQCGAKTTDDEIHLDGRSGFKKVAILLTDGIANTILGSTAQVSTTSAETAAITEIQNEFTRDGTIYFTIGLGNRNGNSETGIDEPFLEKIAQITGGKYYYSPTTDDLNQIYQDISQILGKGSITGFAFNDQNNNGTLDTGEPKLPGWNINLTVGTASATAANTMATDSSGGYSFTGLCSGIYYVTETNQTGWAQTFPVNPNYYKITIASDSASTDNNFGNARRSCGVTCANDGICSGAADGCSQCINGICKAPPVCGSACSSYSDCSGGISGCGLCDPVGHKCVASISATPILTITPTASPSPTLVPQHTMLNLTVFMHNIGNSGDNVSSASGLSNKNPLHPDRNAHITIFDTENVQVADTVGTIHYSSTSGSFNGTVDLGTTLATGKYYLKIQSDYHLRRLVSGIQTITAGKTNTIPAAYLIAGDANKDNQLSLLDYNMLIGCYSVLAPAVACQPGWKDATDFNDDGHVDGTDLNLFLRELSIQNGE